MEPITTTDALQAGCDRLSKSRFITIDTEFLREQTFWPQLCLIQMASPDFEVTVDALAPKLNLEPFFRLMANEDVLKVFHAARQDIEIVHHMAGIIPHPIFDTQVAAMVLGFGESVSYGVLVKKVLGKNLDKSPRFTDWSRRPLSDKQLAYALADVTHLREIYPVLEQRLSENSRIGWLDEEMDVLTAPETYESHPEDAWKRLKLRVKSQRALAVMMEVAAWRETEAQYQDLPRNRILKDDSIYDIADQAPQSVDQLARLRTLNAGFARSARGQAVLEAVERGLTRDLSEVPRLRRGAPMTQEALAVADLLRVLLKAVAAQHGVANKIIATTDDLDKIARSEDADVPALRGWRKQLFGRHALALRRSELTLGVVDGQIALLPVNPQGSGSADVDAVAAKPEDHAPPPDGKPAMIEGA